MDSNSFNYYINKFKDNILFTNDRIQDLKYSNVINLGNENLNERVFRKTVLCMIDNDPQALLFYLYLLYYNAIPIMLSTSLSQEAIDSIIKIYKPNFIFGKSKVIHNFNNSNLNFTVGDYSLHEINKEITITNNNLALLLPTSGSTGSPKYVRLSKINLISNAISICKYLNLNKDEIPITTLPPSYTYGLSIIHSHIIVGAKIIVNNYTFFDKRFWNLVKENKATSFGGVPYHYEMLDKLKFTSMDLPNLKTLTQAGGKLKKELVKKFAEYAKDNRKRFFVMYGQTEATARMSYLLFENSVEKIDSIGKSIPGGIFNIIDEEGNLISDSQIAGELVYKGKNVSMGYATNFNDLGKEDENKEILFTGDIAKKDNDGFYYIVGRKKRFIKLFGKRTNLDEIEEYLLKSSYECICMGEDDKLNLCLKKITKESAKELKKIIIDYLKVPPIAINIIKIPNIPRNESGKILYNNIKKEDFLKIL